MTPPPMRTSYMDAPQEQAAAAGPRALQERQEAGAGAQRGVQADRRRR